MENASNALLMAGGILLAMLIVGLLIFGFTSISEYQDSKNDMKLEKQVAEFNKQYLPYEKENLTLPELKTLYNKIESNNITNPEHKIQLEINMEISAYMQYDFSKIPEKDKLKNSYKCVYIKYDDNGYIYIMGIEKNGK